MKFTKWHGCGNDFVLLDARQEKFTVTSALARQICDRHYGVGADGVLILWPADGADVKMQILNADGSEAEMCGNGIRCLARYAYESGYVNKVEFTVATGAGIMRPRLNLAPDGSVVDVQVDMGEPILRGDDIPVTGFGDGRIVAEPLELDGKRFGITCVSMGNPHCVVLVDDADGFPVERYGSQLEKHPLFPRRTNVEFVQVMDRQHLRMRVWERGAAVTLACGTGACASLVATVLNGVSEREVEITLDGGKLNVRWGDDNRIYMTGAAERVFSGEWDK